MFAFSHDKASIRKKPVGPPGMRDPNWQQQPGVSPSEAGPDGWCLYVGIPQNVPGSLEGIRARRRNQK